MTDRYTLSELNADLELADRVRTAVRAIWSGDATPTDTKVARTAVAVIAAKKKAGYCGVPDPLEAMAEYVRLRKRVAELEATVAEQRQRIAALEYRCVNLACPRCMGTGFEAGGPLGVGEMRIRVVCGPCSGSGRHIDESAGLRAQVDFLERSETAYLQRQTLLRRELEHADRREAGLWETINMLRATLRRTVV